MTLQLLIILLCKEVPTYMHPIAIEQPEFEHPIFIQYVEKL